MSRIFLLNHESVQVLDAFWSDFFFMIDSMISKIAENTKPTRDLIKNYQGILYLEVVAIGEVELGCGHTVSVKKFRCDI